MRKMTKMMRKRTNLVSPHSSDALRVVHAPQTASEWSTLLRRPQSGPGSLDALRVVHAPKTPSEWSTLLRRPQSGPRSSDGL